MGKIDIAMKNCMRHTDLFADCFNAVLRANGIWLRVESDELCREDSELSGFIGKNWYQKTNDIKALWKSRWILSMENQTKIHPGMVVRSVIYDAFTYHKQMGQIRQKHRAEKPPKKQGWFHGFAKEDRLIPSVTAVVYIGREQWDAPESLHEVLDLKPDLGKDEKDFHVFCFDARLLLLDVRHVEQSVIDTMETDMRHLFEMVRRSESKQRLKEYLLEQADAFSHMQADVVKAIMVICEFKCVQETIEKVREGEIDMCKAVRDWEKELRSEGRREGRREGQIEGEGRMSQLVQILLKKEQYDELNRVSTDAGYREEMYAIYGI